MAVLPLWKKPIAYMLRMVQFLGGVALWTGIFSLAGSGFLLGIALIVLAELLYQLSKGNSGHQSS